MNTFLNPDKILDQVELRSNMIAADFGCGSGGFTIPLAHRLEDGLVYGLDVQKEVLNNLKGYALSERINNISLIRCDLEKTNGSTLSDSSIDLVVIANTLFQAEDPKVLISEAKRVLKGGGKLILVDWIPGASQGPAQGRISKDKAKEIAEDIDLKFEKELLSGKYHYGLLFTKL